MPRKVNFVMIDARVPDVDEMAAEDEKIWLHDTKILIVDRQRDNCYRASSFQNMVRINNEEDRAYNVPFCSFIELLPQIRSIETLEMNVSTDYELLEGFASNLGIDIRAMQSDDLFEATDSGELLRKVFANYANGVDQLVVEVSDFLFLVSTNIYWRTTCQKRSTVLLCGKRGADHQSQHVAKNFIFVTTHGVCRQLRAW
ncbi:unnamed protein product, partial [Mesorhabditis spiculigera]